MTPQNYLEKYLPDYVSELSDECPRTIRRFRACYENNPSALKHFSVQQLLTRPALWFIGTDIAKEHDGFLQEVYPQQNIATAPPSLNSIIVCGSCNQRKVDYYQQQIRGADEPMTCFCTCLNCGTRWTQ